MALYAAYSVASQGSLESVQEPRSFNTSHHCFTSSTQVAAVPRHLGQTMFPPSQNTLQGCAAHCGQQTSQGLWDQMWLAKHINVLELQAVCLALQQFLPLLYKDAQCSSKRKIPLFKWPSHAGWYTLPITVSDISGESSLVRTTANLNHGPIHQRRAQHPRGPSLLVGPVIERRMASESVSLRRTMFSLGNSPDQHVLNQLDSQASKVFISNERATVMEDRCVVTSLEQHVPVSTNNALEPHINAQALKRYRWS